jgi:predicted RNase H-like nuclease (RuvC/YqgF family)
LKVNYNDIKEIIIYSKDIRSKMQYLIVGIDPGTTTAFAAMDLDGNIINVRSSKKFGERVLLEEIREIGRPIIIGSDKKVAPSFVKKIASRLSAKLLCPDHNLGTKEKKFLTLKYNLLSHKRDALAAALFAHNQYENLFSRVNECVPRGKRDIVKKKLVLDEARNIQDAMKEDQSKESSISRKRTNKGGDEMSDLKKKNHLLRKRIAEIEESLKEANQMLRNLSRLPGNKPDILSENRLRTIRQMSEEIKELREESRVLKIKNRILSSGGVPVDHEFSFQGRKFVIGERKIKGVIQINKRNLKIKDIDGVDYIDIKDVEKLVSEKLLQKVIQDHRG